MNQDKNNLGRTNRAWLTSVNSILQSTTNTLTVLLVTPLIVRGLGSDQYGIWIILSQIVGYISWADFSPGSALKLSLISKQNDNNYDQKKRLLLASIIIALIGLPIYLIGGIVLQSLLPSLINHPIDNLTSARIALWIIVLSTYLAGFTSLPSNVLRATNNDFKAMGIRSLLLASIGIVDVLVIVFGRGLIGLSLNRLINSIVVAIILFFITKRSVSWFGFLRPQKQDVFNLLKFSPWLYLYTFGYAVFQSYDVILIGWFLGTSITAYYGLTRSLVLLADRMIRPLAMSVNAGMADLYSRGDLLKLVGVREELHAMILLVFFPFGTLICAMNPSFVQLWISKSYFLGQIVNIMFVFGTLFAILSTTEMTLMDACNNIKKRMKWYFYCSIFTVLCGVILINKWGAIGAAISFFVGQIILLLGSQALVNKMLNISMADYWKKLIPLFSFGISISLLSIYISTKLVINTWIQLILYSTLIFLITLSILWGVALRKQQRISLVARFPARIRSIYASILSSLYLLT